MTTTMRRLAGLAGAALFIVGACSSGSSPAPSGDAASITPPAAIAEAGKLVWCVDVSYPPEEFYAEDGTTAQGSDIDIAADIAKRFGVTSQIDNTGFDGIIPALKAKKCDLIISGMNSTDERKQEVDFVDYLKVGQGIMVPVGNPEGIASLEDLSGLAVAVQLGTTNKESLDAVNETLTAAGKPTIDIQTFDKDTDAFQQLALGRVDAYTTDSVVLAYYLNVPENEGKFEIAANIDPIPIGIAVRKEDGELKAAVQAAIDAMYADGTLEQIVDKWKMTDAVDWVK
jgi:polar amino acid transport system substrate-binding protein